MKKLLLLLALALLPAANGIRINEIMYNPVLDDNYFEWVELYSNESFDFRNATISDSAYTDEIMCCRANCSLNRTGYVLVIDKDSKTNFSDALCVDDNSIGNGLGNSGDSIVIKKSGLVIDSVHYNNSLANGNNKTLELFNGSWFESTAMGGTPGFLNSVANISVNLAANITINETLNITTNQTANETNSTINETANMTNNCDASLDIFTNKTIYSNEPIKFRHVLNNESYNFTIEYWIEDLFSTIIKSKRNTTNLNEKSYTPNIDESDKTLLIKSKLSANCSDTDLSNNYAEKLVVVKGEKKEISNTQKTTEEQAKRTQTSSAAAVTTNKFNYEIISYPSEIASGEQFRIKIKVYGDSKEHFLVMRSYVYKGSKHYSDESSKEIVLQADKDEVVELENIAEASPGSYKLKVKIKKDELVTEYDITKEINITEDSAKETRIDFKNETGEKIINSIEMNYTINLTEPKILYSSKSNKAKNLIKYLITGALTAISLVLIWKR